MNIIVPFFFTYDSGPYHETGRAFAIKFDVTPDRRLLAMANHQVSNFDERLDALLDNLDIDFAEEWRDDRYFLGWLTNCQDYHGEALDEVVKLRDFLLAEGFRGGEIIDMTDEDFERFIEVDQTQELLEEAINSL